MATTTTAMANSLSTTSTTTTATTMATQKTVKFTFYDIYDDSNESSPTRKFIIDVTKTMIISKKIYNDNHYTRLEEMKTTTTIITTTTMIDEIKEVDDDGKVFCVSVTIRYTTTIVQHLLLTYIVNQNVRHPPPLSLILAEVFPLTSFCIVFSTLH